MKKGLSNFTTAVIILMLVIVAVTIVWNFVRPTLDEGFIIYKEECRYEEILIESGKISNISSEEIELEIKGVYVLEGDNYVFYYHGLTERCEQKDISLTNFISVIKEDMDFEDYNLRYTDNKLEDWLINNCEPKCSPGTYCDLDIFPEHKEWCEYHTCDNVPINEFKCEEYYVEIIR